jgi:hypothetical protein
MKPVTGWEGLPKVRRRNPNQARKVPKSRGRSPEIMREVGKLGGRPRSIKKVYPTLWALSERMFNDLEVQNRIFEAMRDGTMHPSEVREWMYIYNGRPAYKTEVSRKANGNSDEEFRAYQRLREENPALFKEMARGALAMRKILADQRRALPQATAVQVDRVGEPR